MRSVRQNGVRQWKVALATLLLGTMALAWPLGSSAGPEPDPVAQRQTDTAVAQPAKASGVRPAVTHIALPPSCGIGTARVEISVSLAEIRFGACFPISSDTRAGTRIEPPYSRVATRLVIWATRNIAGTALRLLWDLESRTRIADGLPFVLWPGGESGERGVSTDGESILIWNLSTDEWYDVACRAVGRNMTRAEWDEIGPRDEEYQVTCPQFPREDAVSQ